MGEKESSLKWFWVRLWGTWTMPQEELVELARYSVFTTQKSQNLRLAGVGEANSEHVNWGTPNQVVTSSHSTGLETLLHANEASR